MPSERRAGHSGPPPVRLAVLAREIAARFETIAPEGFSCVAYDTLVILVRGHRGVRGLDLADLDWEPGHWGEDLRNILWQILSDFQDEIVEQLSAAWPAIPGGAGIAVPHAELMDGVVQGSYQSGDRPVVRLEPIPV